MNRDIQLQRPAWLGMRRSQLAAALAALGLTISCALPAHADSKDGTFPTAEQVGGEVYQAPLKIGSILPTDFEAYDSQAKKVDFGTVIHGKRSLVVFFISAVPVSVNELKRIEEFVDKNAAKVNLVFVNADTVGVALEGGPQKAISSTASTVRLIAKEHGLKRPMYVAPNDALSPTGLSNRLAFRGLPTSYLVSDKGAIEKIFVGPQQWKKGDI
jgi:hypothetical protein